MNEIVIAEDKSLFNSKVQELIVGMSQMDVIDLEIVHRFTPGIYVRQCNIPKGTIAVTKRHKTEHPFVVSQGRVSVWTPDKGVVDICAPFTGVTKPGTQRVILAYTDTIWTTFHATSETDLDLIESEVIEKTELPLEIPVELRNQLDQMYKGKAL